MSKKSKSLYTVHVWTEGRELPLVAYFDSRKEASEYEFRAQRKPGVTKVDMSPGYMLFKTADEALDNLQMWVM